MAVGRAAGRAVDAATAADADAGSARVRDNANRAWTPMARRWQTARRLSRRAPTHPAPSNVRNVRNVRSVQDAAENAVGAAGAASAGPTGPRTANVYPVPMDRASATKRRAWRHVQSASAKHASRERLVTTANPGKAGKAAAIAGRSAVRARTVHKQRP